MQSNLLEQTVADVLREALSATDAALYVVNPSEATVEELVHVMAGLESPPTVNVLAAERTLKDVMGDFKLASTAADLRDDGSLAMRTYESDDNTLLVTEGSVVAVVAAGDRVAGLATDDAEFIEGAHAQYTDTWETAQEFSLRTPAISTVRTTLEEDLGPDAADDFDAVLGSLQTARGNGDGLDEVTISLLVAAKNEELLYDISKWGEDVGIASKATFSRTKTKLEDLGLIVTEKVPIDVGRPRLRLMLGDDRLKGADAEQLTSVAQSILASH
ncbi:transcriptional regulator TbsP [Natronomonas sp. EA1]|uniref:transcriptional regulator TbsP n=1 Tax=Natronomonas sp. EA1 TaxID=3421655 RepID=UPI003EBABFC1